MLRYIIRRLLIAIPVVLLVILATFVLVQSMPGGPFDTVGMKAMPEHIKIVLVKLGGSILENPDLQKKLLTDIVFMATVGIRPIIVHGGGKAITKAMSQAGLEPQWRPCPHPSAI